MPLDDLNVGMVSFHLWRPVDAEKWMSLLSCGCKLKSPQMSLMLEDPFRVWMSCSVFDQNMCRSLGWGGP